jgi:epoxyqueuosine reductase
MKFCADIANSIKNEARRLGFDACGIAQALLVDRRDYFLDWLSRGCAGDMTAWLGRDPDKRLDPRKMLPGCKTVIVVAMNYFHEYPPGRGRIARYALGKDYHDAMGDKLRQLGDFLAPHGGLSRPFVDSTPVMERPLAELAGLGWQGKNGMLTHKRMGNWFFLGGILTTLEMPTDPPARDLCGSCDRCMRACPTGAITSPYRLDARLCIAYLTIEHKGPIPTHLRRAVGSRLFGCDDCLEVCPWNRWAVEARETAFRPIPRPDLREMLFWNETAFRQAFGGTPIYRLGEARWRRNICVVLGNIGGAADLPALHRAAADSDLLVREHAQWAIDALGAR